MSDAERQADVGDWVNDFQDDEKSKGGGSTNKRTPFMQLKQGDNTVRLVGNHVKFRRHWAPFSARVITHDDYKNQDPAWQAGFYPRETFAIHVIDRADGKLKILEKGKSLFKQFARYNKVNDVNPAGKDGTDWVISVEGSGLQTSYSATAKSKPTPFTEAEIEMIKANKAPLKEIYKTTPIEKIKELWDALPDEAKVAPKREEAKDKDSDSDSHSEKPKGKAASKVEEVDMTETMPDSPAESDDLFGDDDETAF